MKFDYGYIRGTEGVDGDHIDVFLSRTPEQGDVYVVDQVNEDGSFDEHKVMYGFGSEGEARAAYLSNYEEGWQGLGALTRVSREEFKKWVRSSKRKTKPFAEYKGVKTGGTQFRDNSMDAELFDAINTLYNNGKVVANELYQMRFFDVAQTPEFMKELGLTGEKFTIRYGVIARHFGKDNDHDLPIEVWEQIPDALQRPFAISNHFELNKQGELRQKGYRIYLSVWHNGKPIIIGASVRNGGPYIEVNSIDTVFAVTRPSDTEEIIYTSENITPEEQSLLNGPNSHQYTARRELSDSEVNTSFSDIQTNVGESSDAESISGGLDMGEESDVDIAREAVGTDRGARMQFRITGVPAVAAAAVYESRVRTAGYQVQEAFQDSMLGLRAAYEAIENGSRFSSKPRKIEDIPDAQNAYLFENRMSSLNQEEQR